MNNVSDKVKIGIIGDFDKKKPSHIATNDAIRHASSHLKIPVEITWLSTPSFLEVSGQNALKHYDGIWISPGSPYESLEGVLSGIQLAREMNKPLIGT